MQGVDAFGWLVDWICHLCVAKINDCHNAKIQQQRALCGVPLSFSSKSFAKKTAYRQYAATPGVEMNELIFGCFFSQQKTQPRWQCLATCWATLMRTATTIHAVIVTKCCHNVIDRRRNTSSELVNARGLLRLSQKSSA